MEERLQREPHALRDLFRKVAGRHIIDPNTDPGIDHHSAEYGLPDMSADTWQESHTAMLEAIDRERAKRKASTEQEVKPSSDLAQNT